MLPYKYLNLWTVWCYCVLLSPLSWIFEVCCVKVWQSLVNWISGSCIILSPSTLPSLSWYKLVCSCTSETATKLYSLIAAWSKGTFDALLTHLTLNTKMDILLLILKWVDSGRSVANPRMATFLSFWHPNSLFYVPMHRSLPGICHTLWRHVAPVEHLTGLSTKRSVKYVIRINKVCSYWLKVYIMNNGWFV